MRRVDSLCQGGEGALRVQPSDYEELVQHDRVHGSLYTDPAIFSDELDRIFYREWVYVGHQSEVPEPGDYCQKHIGRQSVVMTRDREGQIHLLLNRCPHRANLVCEAQSGNSRAFRCPYHGWTFSNSGALLGRPHPAGYDRHASKNNLEMAHVPRVQSYQGFVFGSFAEHGPDLREHLGPAAETLDRLVALSPAGELQLSAGWVRHGTATNWKMVVENETDGYHAPFVHRSVFSTAEGRIGDIYGEDSFSIVRDLGNGHTEIDPRPELRRIGETLHWFGTTPDRFPGYVAAMRKAYGQDRAREILVDGAPHVMIFPNLFIAEVSIFVIQPVAVDYTIQHVTPVQLKGAPEMNRRLLSQCVASVGPAGMLLADDSSMYERNFAGVQMRQPEWCVLTRGLHRESRDANGHLTSNATDETPMRAMWRHYRTLMAGVPALVDR